ncbi:hypothetical protein [Marinobacter subterrani]|uniref:Lipoprotein n=1 Tax=Marinobacter subterrani TaxID=1658765 RepID=A0A0J7J3F2_9GAMM|nr:hypothetical protein [Marinobacter subterrani]KMQ73033.1 hypothetical protein Msub_20229 [Marinobacter subterrani]
MKALMACGIFLISLISGCAALYQQPTEFRTSNGIIFKLNSRQFDTVDIQPLETQLWRESKLVGSVITVETNPEFSTAMGEVRQGYREAQKSSGVVRELDLGEGVYGFSATINSYTTAFIATSTHPSAWITISTDENIFDDVLSTLTVN